MNSPVKELSNMVELKEEIDVSSSALRRSDEIFETIDINDKVFRVRYEADTDENRRDLMKNICEGNRMQVESLMEMGVDTNFVDEDGMTPLKIAVIKRHVSIIALLLSRASTTDVNHTDEVGQPALMAAVRLPQNEEHETTLNLSIIKLILDVPGVNVNAQDSAGNTSLLFAVALKDLSITNELLKAGANTNVANLSGTTPLHIAVINVDKPMVELLIEYGARLLRDLIGKTPLDYASPIIKQIIGNTPASPLIQFVSTQKYRPSSRKLQLGITSIGSPGPSIQPWLLRDLRVLVQHNCNLLVTLLDEGELAEMGISDLFSQLGKYNIESVHFPIQKWLPRVGLDQFMNVIKTIVDKMREDQIIILHSDSGRGRTGLVAAGVLISIGYSQEEAISIIDGLDTNLLKNPAYHIYLSAFSSEVNEIREQKVLDLVKTPKSEKQNSEKSSYLSQAISVSFI